jgi:tetratricopeptide (TPR) repeat protein
MSDRATWLAGLALMLALFAPVAFPVLAAAEPAEPEEAKEEEPIDLEALAIERRVKSVMYPVNQRVSRYLAAAAEASEAGDPAKGKALLQKLNLKRLNPYERALVYRLKGYVAYAAGEYESTIDYFEKVLAEEVMSLDIDNSIRFNIAQLYGSLQKWDQVVKALDRWFRYVQTPNPLAYYLLGLSYYQLQDFDLAIENTRKAVDASPEPAEGWIQLLAALYIQQEKYAEAVPVLEELVVRFPKKTYWVQLSLIYGARDDFRSSLAAQQVAYLQGFIDEDKELRRLARSYLYHELPYPAARVLEMGLEEGKIERDAAAYELLANSWIAAREYDKSLPPLERAAELSGDGKLFVRIGQVHLQREEWSEAADSLQHGLDKGGLDNAGQAFLLLGIAHYNADRRGPARAAFERALRHESTRAEADRWIAHLAEDQKEELQPQPGGADAEST